MAQFGRNAAGIKIGLNSHSFARSIIYKELSYQRYTTDLNKFEISLGQMAYTEETWTGALDRYSLYMASVFYNFGIRAGGPKSKFLIGTGLQPYLFRNVYIYDGEKGTPINQIWLAGGLQFGYERVITVPAPLILSLETRFLMDPGTLLYWGGYGIYGTIYRADFAFGVKYPF